jgi:hypothetical protein
LTVVLVSLRAPHISPWIHYLSISGIVMLNELVVYLWRNKRDVALLSLDE